MAEMLLMRGLWMGVDNLIGNTPGALRQSRMSVEQVE